jgi:hypothetical protein
MWVIWMRNFDAERRVGLRAFPRTCNPTSPNSLPDEPIRVLETDPLDSR